MTPRCTCRPRDPEGWVNEECPTHGREAQEARRETQNEPEPEAAESGNCEWMGHGEAFMADCCDCGLAPE